MESIASKFGVPGIIVLFAWRFLAGLQGAIERGILVGEAFAKKFGVELPPAAPPRRLWFLPTAVAAILVAIGFSGCSAVGGAAKGTLSTCSAVGGATMKGAKKAVCGVVDTLAEVGHALCGDDEKAPAPAPAPEAAPTMPHDPPPEPPACEGRDCAVPTGDARAYLPPRR